MPIILSRWSRDYVVYRQTMTE